MPLMPGGFSSTATPWPTSLRTARPTFSWWQPRKLVHLRTGEHAPVETGQGDPLSPPSGPAEGLQRLRAFLQVGGRFARRRVEPLLPCFHARNGEEPLALLNCLVPAATPCPCPPLGCGSPVCRRLRNAQHPDLLPARPPDRESCKPDLFSRLSPRGYGTLAVRHRQIRPFRLSQSGVSVPRHRGVQKRIQCRGARPPPVPSDHRPMGGSGFGTKLLWMWLIGPILPPGRPVRW